MDTAGADAANAEAENILEGKGSGSNTSGDSNTGVSGTSNDRAADTTSSQTEGTAVAVGAQENAVPASDPVGRKGSPLELTPGTNTPADIDGTQFVGHALDRMQGRGITPSVVKSVIETGNRILSSDGTSVIYDPINNISVVVNADGAVVTVGYGAYTDH